MLRGTLTLLAAALTQPYARVVADAPTLEYQVKASYLFNFIRFVEWPPDATPVDAFRLCVYGENRFGSALDSLAGEKVRGAPIVIQHLRQPHGLDACHAVFISSIDHDQETRALTRLRGLPVLVIGESAGFIDRGGTVNLILVDDRIRFVISQQSAHEHGLRISAQLLQLSLPQ